MDKMWSLPWVTVLDRQGKGADGFTAGLLLRFYNTRSSAKLATKPKGNILSKYVNPPYSAYLPPGIQHILLRSPLFCCDTQPTVNTYSEYKVTRSKFSLFWVSWLKAI